MDNGWGWWWAGISRRKHGHFLRVSTQALNTSNTRFLKHHNTSAPMLARVAAREPCHSTQQCISRALYTSTTSDQWLLLGEFTHRGFIIRNTSKDWHLGMLNATLCMSSKDFLCFEKLNKIIPRLYLISCGISNVFLKISNNSQDFTFKFLEWVNSKSMQH